MATTVFRSELVYHAPVEISPVVEVKPAGPVLTERIQKGIDSVIEYPGSRKGDFGEWRLTDWLDGKIQQIVNRGGTERK